MLREGDGIASRVLEAMGVNQDKVNDCLVSLIVWLGLTPSCFTFALYICSTIHLLTSAAKLSTIHPSHISRSRYLLFHRRAMQSPINTYVPACVCYVRDSGRCAFTHTGLICFFTRTGS